MHIMACCLLAPSHCMSLCCLIINSTPSNKLNMFELIFNQHYTFIAMEIRLKMLSARCGLFVYESMWWLNNELHFFDDFYIFLVTLSTHCGIVKPYGDIDLGQHWLRQWLVVWRHQAITSSNFDISLVRFCGIHPRAISQRVPKNK